MICAGLGRRRRPGGVIRASPRGDTTVAERRTLHTPAAAALPQLWQEKPRDPPGPGRGRTGSALRRPAARGRPPVPAPPLLIGHLAPPPRRASANGLRLRHGRRGAAAEGWAGASREAGLRAGRGRGLGPSQRYPHGGYRARPAGRFCVGGTGRGGTGHLGGPAAPRPWRRGLAGGETRFSPTLAFLFAVLEGQMLPIREECRRRAARRERTGTAPPPSRQPPRSPPPPPAPTRQGLPTSHTPSQPGPGRPHRPPAGSLPAAGRGGLSRRCPPLPCPRGAAGGRRRGAGGGYLAPGVPSGTGWPRLIAARGGPPRRRLRAPHRPSSCGSRRPAWVPPNKHKRCAAAGQDTVCGAGLFFFFFF